MNSIREELVSKIIEIHSNSSIKNELIRRTTILQNKRKSGEIEQKAIRPQYASKTTKSVRPVPKDIKLIIIGISTGGPVALMEFVPKLNPTLKVPIVIAQHMPPHFTKSLADRLNANSKVKVKEAEDNEKIITGSLYIAPGGMQTRVQRNGRLLINNMPENELYKPSVNVLLDSATDSYSNQTMCIIMTGMGKDGSEACSRLKLKNGYIVAQELTSCVVQGMPNAVLSAGLADDTISLTEMSNYINKYFA
jgi:two-component system chemotaxis response regulator CheB